MVRCKNFLDGDTQLYNETIYYNTGDTLPTDVAMGSVATNPENKEVKMFDGTDWVVWNEGEV